MKKINALSVEQLQTKQKSLKVLIGLFIFLIIALSFFVFKDYLGGQDLDWAIITIIICTIGGLVSTYSELNLIGEELKKRI